MYASIGNTVTPRSTVSRAALRTRPRVQRILIRYWEYVKPVRVTFLVLRLLVVAWLVFLGVALLYGGIQWGGLLFPAAAGTLALSGWIFKTAGKGWPAVKG
jgi:hypothetical protein